MNSEEETTFEQRMRRESLREQLLDICFPEPETDDAPDPADATEALVQALAFMIVVVGRGNIPSRTTAAIQRLQAAVDQRLAEHIMLKAPTMGPPSDTTH
jgi:hypothetical protein